MRILEQACLLRPSISVLPAPGTVGRDRRALGYVLRLGCKNIFWLGLTWEPKIDSVDIRDTAVWHTGAEIVEGWATSRLLPLALAWPSSVHTEIL